MAIPAACHEDRQVEVCVRAAVAHAAAEEHLGRVEQIGRRQPVEEPRELLHLKPLDLSHAGHERRILAVVREPVVAPLGSDGGGVERSRHLDRGHAGGVGLQREQDEIEEDRHLLGDAAVAGLRDASRRPRP